MKSNDETVNLDLSDEQKKIIEVTLGHLAIEQECKEPQTVQELRSIIRLVMDEEPISRLDCHTVWVTLDRKEGIDFPAQPYDEDKAAEGAKEVIDEAVGGIPEEYKED